MVYPVIRSDYHYEYRAYLSVLFAVNVFSLLFDLRDGWQWLTGARKVVRRKKTKTRKKRIS
jgi:hypothetical protein